MPFQAWILAVMVFAAPGIGWASMGPCLFRHGYDDLDRGSGPVKQPLQWGHAFSGMDIPQPTTGRRKLRVLQWGHAFSGMDISKRFCEVMNLSIPLQWGHAFSGMDISPCELLRHGKNNGFNGAMPFQAWISGM